MRHIIALFVIVLSLAEIARGKEGSPEQQVVALYKQLASDKRGTAFQEFFAGSLMAAQKPSEVKAMDSKARVAWDFYGAPESYEILQRNEIGKSLFRIKWLTKSKDEIPLFWSALFYRRSESWEPLTIFFYDDPDRAGI